MRITHSYTDDSATIRIEGLAVPVRMLHLTDTHILLFDERDGEHQEACRDFCRRFATSEIDDAGNSYVPDVAFRQAMANAATAPPDLLALTGDIVHYPTAAAVEYVAAEIAALGVSPMYTCGNHDVHYTDEPVNAQMRLKWLPALQPLHNGDPDCAAQEIGGIRFVCIDSAVGQISAKQLQFMKQQLEAGRPTVLLTHWPLSLPTLRDQTIAVMKAPTLLGDPDWSAQSRDDWQVTADTPDTIEFVHTVAAAANLAAVFCGHIHFAHADAINNRAVQYVTRAGFEGGRRMIEFLPL